MTKKTLIMLVGVVAFTFVAIAVYAATDTSPAPMDNTSITAAEFCCEGCNEDCCKDCCKDCDGDCENCEDCCKECDQDCENCDDCDKPCKGQGSGCGGCGERPGACPMSQKPNMCNGHRKGI